MKIKINTVSGIKEIDIRHDETVINLSNMQIRVIDLDFLNKLENLESINLSNNFLETIDLQPLENCSNLTSLRLANNRLSKIYLKPLQSCLNLEILDLSHNYLTELDLSPLITCSLLKSVNLSFNKLKTIDLTSFSMLVNLRTFNISNNNLSNIDLKKLVFCVALKELDLANNNFESLDLTPVFGFRNLKRLYLSEKEKDVADWDMSYLKYQQLSSGIRSYFQEIKRKNLVHERKKILSKVLEKYITIKLSKLATFLGFEDTQELESWILKQDLKNLRILGSYALINQEQSDALNKEISKLMSEFDQL